MTSSTSRRDSIIQVLREHGPLPTVEVAAILEVSVKLVSVSIQRTLQNHPRRYIHIDRYEQRVGSWAADFAVYAAGPGRDAERRKLSKAERRAAAQKRYRAKHAARLQAERAVQRGRSHAVNPWMQLAPIELHPHMGRVAANTALQRAA